LITPLEKKVLSDLKNSLRALTGEVEIQLFGSRARGDNDPDADFDILIVVPYLTKELKSKIRDIVWQAGFDNDMFISSLIVSKRQWQEGPLRVSPIKKAIEQEGVPL